MRFLHTMIRVGDLDKSIKFYAGRATHKILRRGRVTTERRRYLELGQS